MSRPAVIVVLLLSMLWQSLAMARVVPASGMGPGLGPEMAANLAHAALHLQKAAHHHHDDGSLHFDDSKESVQHALVDHLSSSAALLCPSEHCFSAAGSTFQHRVLELPLPHPFLDGLLRPPRLQA